MPLSVRLSPEEEQLLERTAKKLGRSKSDLARQAVQELCHKLLHDETSPHALGEDLFDSGELAGPPRDPRKRQIWESLREKHRHLGR